jgi:glycosyltransferase involved in cell wall biosynthesis
VTVYQGRSVAVIIPALDEALSIAKVIRQLDQRLVDWVVVGDNGSSDGTPKIAAAAGALVVHEPRRGYGSACLKAIAAVPRAEVLVFLDADGSDDPRELSLLLEALFTGNAEIVIGARLNDKAEPGSLTPVQKFGNTLTCGLVRLFWRARYTDLGPFRALRRSTFDQLGMVDPDFGWTIEMQVKAAQMGLEVVEVPVSYRRRQGGSSKVSGTILGSFRAGKRILEYVFAAKFRELVDRTRRTR